MELPGTKTTSRDFTRKLCIRFFCIYFLLYIFPFPLDLFSDSNFIISSFREFWGKLVPLVGKYFFGIDVGPRGGDTVFHYTRIFSIFLVSILVSLIWTIADRQPGSDKDIRYWTNVYVRYYIAYNMLDYGFSKVFNIQFAPQFPNLNGLVEPYGEFSPQGLLWKFMGYSKSYQVFTGSIEILGGLLLLFRRTTTAGSLILIAVMSNVVMMNWSYDIPVKIYSSHLLLMAIFLAAPDAVRMINFFLLNKTVLPAEQEYYIGKQWIRVSKLFLKAFFICYLVYIPFRLYSGLNKTWSSDKKPPLYGLYTVESFVVNQDTIPPLLTDSIRWKRMIIDYPGMWANVQLMNESLKTYDLKTDTTNQTGIISFGPDSLDRFVFDYSHPEKDILAFTGRWKQDSVFIKMKRQDINQFRLVRWKSRWIYRKEKSNY